ncbi:MAG TPA: hypothetical protein DCM28_23455 [Phycisphaerales bacterium]|nr:hypothetical protein [Phycisphaerales bacterium]|tara:strand:- start:780 stop:1445 length:666 start_codon:yes stop_codon:yes gene_type:complete
MLPKIITLFLLSLATTACSTTPNIADLTTRAHAGEARAQFELASCYDMGHGFKLDRKQAALWYQRASDQGYMPAKINLGWLYQMGQGVEQNFQTAIALYRQAADKEYPQAQHNLACIYDEGLGIKEDNKQAVSWYQKAADHGHPRACLNLGVMYMRGEGIATDVVKAYQWLTIARLLMTDKNDKWVARAALDHLGKTITAKQRKQARDAVDQWFKDRQQSK